MKIPRDNRRGLVEQQVPGADISVRDAGAPEHEIAKMGYDLAEIGMAYGQQAHQAEADNYAFTKRNEDEIEIEKYSSELKLKKGADPQGYAADMDSFLKERIVKNEEEAPSQLAKQNYNRYAQQTYTKHFIDAHGYEQTKRAEFWRDDIDRQASGLASLNLQNPDPVKTTENFAVVEDQIRKGVGKNFTAEQAEAQVQFQRERFTESLLDGYRMNEKPELAMRFLNDKSNPLVASLDSKKLGNVMAEVKGRMEQKQREQAHETTASMRDVLYQLKTGTAVDPSQISTVMNQIQANPQFKGDEKQRNLDTIKSAMEGNKVISQLRTASPEKMVELEANLQKSLGDGTYNAANRGEIKQSFMEAKTRVIRERNEDGAGYVMKDSKVVQDLFKQAQSGSPMAMRDYVKQSLAKQTELGIAPGKQRIMPKFYSASIANTLLSQGTNPQGASVVIAGLKDTFGPHFEKAFEELTEDHKDIDKGLIVAAHATSDQARYRIVDNVLNKEAIVKRFSDVPQVTSDLKEEVATQMNDVNSAFGAMSNDGSVIGVSNALEEQVSLEAKRLMGTPNSQLDSKKAVRQAYDTVINANFFVVGSANTTLIMPKKLSGYDVDPDKVRNFVRHYSQPEALKELRPVSPQGVDPDKWNEYLAERGKWVTTPDRTGVRFVAPMPGDSKMRVWKFRNSQGKLQNMERHYLDISNIWHDKYAENLAKASAQ